MRRLVYPRITSTDEDAFISQIALASVHPANLTKISWVVVACGEAGVVAV
jgi:hypothetical protein